MYIYQFGSLIFAVECTWVPCLFHVCLFCVRACHKRFAWGLSKDVYLWLLVFSLVFLLSSIAVVKSPQSLSFLFSFFHFIKICQQPGGPFGCCLAAKYFFFCFPSLQTPLLPVFSLKRTLTGVCSELFIFHYLALSCLLTQGWTLSRDP